MSDADQTQPIDDESWPALREWIEEAGNLVDLIEADEDDGASALATLEGVGEETALGAIVRHAAGIVVDDWLVLLGAGGGGFPSVRDVNGRAEGAVGAIPGALVIAIDRLGGGFAINGGGLPEGEVGEVCYLAPDDLEWMGCGFGYTALLEWAFEGDVDGFYDDLRWPSWREEAAALRPGMGLIADPPPWSDDGEDPGVRRQSVPLIETWGVVLTTSLRRGTWTPAGGGR